MKFLDFDDVDRKLAEYFTTSLSTEQDGRLASTMAYLRGFFESRILNRNYVLNQLLKDSETTQEPTKTFKE